MIYGDKAKNKLCDKIIKDFFDFENLSKTVILRLIKKIEIYQDKQINIYFNFKKLS